jgi:hypothetical protein
MIISLLLLMLLRLSRDIRLLTSHHPKQSLPTYCRPFKSFVLDDILHFCACYYFISNHFCPSSPRHPTKPFTRPPQLYPFPAAQPLDHHLLWSSYNQTHCSLESHPSIQKPRIYHHTRFRRPHPWTQPRSLAGSRQQEA